VGLVNIESMVGRSREVMEMLARRKLDDGYLLFAGSSVQGRGMQKVWLQRGAVYILVVGRTEEYW